MKPPANLWAAIIKAISCIAIVVVAALNAIFLIDDIDGTIKIVFLFLIALVSIGLMAVLIILLLRKGD